MPKRAKRAKTAPADEDGENAEPMDTADLGIDDSEDEDYDGQDEQDGYDEDEEGGIGSGPAGTIEVVRVENFMNHENLEMVLNPGMNCIIGENGSGKSAMCHAAQVALGGTAKDTNRGSSIAKFVRHGQPSCLVHLQLCNAPEEDAFEFDMYGPSIIIERRINSSGGGSYALKNSAGKIVSRKRQDLDPILEHYNIQVDNPCSVLTQETSKRLATGKSDYKYEFYLKATGLKSALDELKFVRDAQSRIQLICDRHAKERPNLKSQYDHYEKEFEDASQLFELQANKDDFEKQLVWSHVKDARDIVTTCEEDLDAARHSSAQRAAQIEEMKATMESHKPTVKRLEQESNAYAQNIQADLAEINKLKHRAKQAKDRAKSKKKEVGTMNRSKQEKATEIKDMQEDIEQRQREQSQPSGGGTDQGKLAQDLQDAEASLTATQERHQQLQSQLEEVGDRDELFKKAQKKYSQEVASEKKQAERAKRDVQYQQKNAQNTNARFGEDIARLMDRVEQNARRFQRKPIGPVGAFVQLKDQKWATAAEVAIGPRALRTIIVHSSADEQLMEKMIKAAGVRRNNIFLCRMAIDDRSYQETGKLKTSTFPSSNFTNVMDVITVSNVAVQNFLWDQQVYRNLLFTNDKAAAATAHGNQQRNVKRCYDLEGSQYWKTGNSKSTMPFDSSNMRNLLASDASQLTRRLERQLAAAQDAMRECEQKWLQEQRQFLVDGKTPQQISAQIKKEFVALAKEQGRLGRKIDKLLEQQHDEEGEADEARLRAEEIQTLTQATQRCEDEIEQIEGSIVEHQRELDALETQYTQAEEETAEFKRQSDSRHGQQEQIFADLDLAKKKEGKLKRKLAEFERESKESRVAVNKADKDCAAAQKLVEDETRKARQFCEMEEEVTPTKSTAQLEKKILMIEERLKRAAKRQGGRSLDDITHDRDKAHKALQAFATVADNLVALNDLIHKSFKQRKKTYRIFRRNSANWSRKMFNKNLAKKGHHGDISFDHKNNTLDLKVMLGQDGAAEGGRAVTNTRTLSGGEKSFTTLCLLLALGTVTDVPFAIFDEIDVYMDDVNRKVTNQALHDASAQNKGKRQYCVLTPHDLTGIKADPDTKILHMPKVARLS